MAKDEFDIGKMIGGLGASIDSMKEAVTHQFGALNVRLDMSLAGQKETEKVVAYMDKKLDAANYRLDDITDPDGKIMLGIKYAHNYNDNKKKATFLAGLLVSLGAAAGWVVNLLFK